MKYRRLIPVLVAALLIAVTMFPSATALAAADVSAIAVTTHQSMRITTAAGALITPDASGNYTDVPKDAKLYVEYAFSLPNFNEALDPEDPAYDYHYFAGDYIDVQLPYAVSFSAPVGGWNVIDADTSEVMGTLTIDPDGLARIVFNDYVERYSNIEGWFNLEGTFKAGIFDVGDPVEINVAFAGTTVNIVFHDDRPAFDISADKNGTYDAEHNRINWTVTVTPNRATDDVTIVDTFSNNQTYVPGSFKRGEDAIDDADLTITPGATTTQITCAGVSLPSGDTDFSYQTEPTATAFAAETGSVESVDFHNDVAVFQDGDPYPTDNATVSINWIQKSGAVVGTSLADSRLIRWTVAVNAGGYDLTGCTITDTIPKDLVLVENDALHPIRFGSTDLTGDGSGNPNTYTVITGDPGDPQILIVHLGNLTGTGTLTFYTRVDNEDLYTGNSTTLFTNNAEFNWTENESSTPSDSYGVRVGQGVLSKAAGSTVNYNDATNREINWTVVVNRNLINITNAVFSDTISAGQEYVAESFSINDTEGVFGYNSGTLTYTFGETRTISDMYTITFKTRISIDTPLYVNLSGVAFTNTAELTGDSTLDIDVTATGTQRYNSQVVAKTVQTGYDHTTKRVTWRIVVNRNSLPLTDALLTDTIPAGMTFLPETFSISGVSDPVADALTYTVNSLDDITSQDSFTYMFPSAYSDTATITYQTQVKEAALLTQGAKSYSNTARLRAGSLDASSTAVASMTNTMVTKSMEYITGADYADWKIVINGEGITMNDISVSDVLQAGLEIDIESVVLYPMTLAANGTLTRGSTPVSQSLYTVTYDSTTRTLVFGIPGTINSPYQLEFLTDIVASPIAINNTVVLNGTSYSANSVVDHVSVQVSESGLGGSGVQGSITIEKVGESEEPLAGAVFTLYNNRGEFVREATTDETGSVTFSGLPIRTYVLEETTAPTGHVRSEETVRFRMSTDVPDVFYQFADVKIRADVIVLKTGTDNVPLSGAEFSLYDKDDKLVDTQTTGTDGKAAFEDLEYGDYTIVETKAPQRYLRNTEPIPVSITTVDDVNVTSLNTLIHADVIVHKTDMYSAPLAGAEFSLYDAGNNLIDTKTTGADGIVVFEGLPYGTYSIVETKAPDGYVRAEGATPVTIASTEDVNVTISNKPYEIPQTGGWLDTWTLLACGGALILVGAVWLIVRRRVHAR